MGIDLLKIEILQALSLLEKYFGDILEDVRQGVITESVANYVEHRLNSVKIALADPSLSVKQICTLCIPATLDLRLAVKHYPGEAYIYDNWLDAFSLASNGEAMFASEVHLHD